MTDNVSLVSGAATRYASALYELAADDKAVDKVEADIGRLETLLNESADLMRLVKSPVYGTDDQARALGAVLDKAKIGGLVANFVRLVATNRRLFALPEMLRAFHALAAAGRGEITADVVSATPLSDDNLVALKDALKASTGKDVQINPTVDPALIGGLIVKVGSRMIDTSLRTKLNSLKLSMKEVG